MGQIIVDEFHSLQHSMFLTDAHFLSLSYILFTSKCVAGTMHGNWYTAVERENEIHV